MSAQYSRDHCKIAVAKILQTIGWHSINSTPLEVLTDILGRYIQQISHVTCDYAHEFGQTEANLDHLGLAFHEMGIHLPELEEYVTYVNFAPGPAAAPKFPVSKENSLNFLKPGSKEVVTRPVHIHEHLPPMYPLLEGADSEKEPMAVKQEEVEEESAEPFKRPADVSSPEFRRPKREEEGIRPTREISSVMMTTSGFLSPAREGKLPEARTPAPPPAPDPVPPVSTSPVDSGRKKVDKKKEKVGKELFKPIPEEKTAKKTPTVKDVVKMKQMKAAAANIAAANPVPNPAPSPGIVVPNEVKIMPIPQTKAVQKQNFSKDLAAAKAKTEKFNTTITPIPMKQKPPHPPPPIPLNQVDKLFTEPDKKKVNIFKKISNVKEKHESKAKKDIRTNLLMNEASPVDIVNKITHLSSDITIEPIMNPVQVNRSPDKLDSYYENNSPIGAPSRGKTPDMISSIPPMPKEKRKRKESAPKRKRIKKNVNILEPEVDITMDRPKTPDAHLLPHMRHGPNLLPPAMQFPNILRYSGPGLIPNQLNDSLPLFPFPYMAAAMPDFGTPPYFPPVLPNIPPQVRPAPPPKAKEAEKSVEIIPHPPPTPQVMPVEELAPGTSSPLEANKKTKDHKKEKKDKLKKKNKKDKVKEKSEKKKLKGLKKDNKEKIKKEKKEKKIKEKETREGESPIPKILLKVNSPSPRPETPESTRKLNIKPIVKKDQELVPEEQKREPSPGGLAKISALVTGPPKPKNTVSPVVPVVAERLVDDLPPVPISKTPGRPRMREVKPKPPPKPKKIEQAFKKTDEHGNEVWICPACGQQDDGRPMIGCDGCDAWYHWVCVGIQVPPDENENWYCKPCLCRKNEDLQSDKKKKRKKRDKKEH